VIVDEGKTEMMEMEGRKRKDEAKEAGTFSMSVRSSSRIQIVDNIRTLRSILYARVNEARSLTSSHAVLRVCRSGRHLDPSVGLDGVVAVRPASYSGGRRRGRREERKGAEETRAREPMWVAGC
jgi:hypothetical protein